MSTVPPSTPYTPPLGSSGPVTKSQEIKLISHSTLFYWWPVWALSFFLALWTYIEDHRLAIVPPGGTVTQSAEGKFELTFKNKKGEPASTASLDQAVKNTGVPGNDIFNPRVSEALWPGTIFVIGLVLTIIVTNVPLRGLWSFVTIILVVVIALFISLLKAWDDIYKAFGSLHIHINMAGYLFIGIAVFILWAVATFIFDRRSYVIFTPGQIRVCEHIGASVETFNTFGVGMEKQRDDLFRHYILGFGSGDLILKVPGDKREIKLPNVLGIGWRLKAVEDMLRSVATAA